MTWWAGWAATIRYALARAETNELAFKEARRFLVQKGMYERQGKYEKITELKAIVEQTDEVKNHDKELLKAQAMKAMLSALLDGYEKKYTVISREISRRQQEMSGRA
jgi:hypothetical protein